MSSISNLLIVCVSFMHCTDLQAVRMPLLILLGVCTLSFFEFNILLEIYNMMKLIFITGLATCFNCVPDDVRMIN